MTDFNGASMINETRRWLTWVEGGVAGAQRMIEIAKAKPAGLKQDSNLLLDDQGHVWEHDWNRRVYAELARTTAFGPYAATGRIVPDDGRIGQMKRRAAVGTTRTTRHRGYSGEGKP